MGRKVSILIVEDDPIFSKTLSDILKGRGWFIDVADTGQEALAKVTSGSYDVVLIDLRLPDLVGTELFQPLQRASPQTVVIVLTGFADLESAIKAVNARAFAYLTKPLEVDELLSKIEEALTRKAISKREAVLKREYWKRSITDALTGVYNRRYFDDLLLREIAYGERYGESFALLMIDIDGFKAYNDAYGHVEGDRALQRIASLLKHHARRTDSLARYGGEEFALIMLRTKKEEALLLAERLRGVIERAHLEKGKPMLLGRLTISIGIAAYPTDATTAEELVARADAALYVAKAKGKNKICLYDVSQPKGTHTKKRPKRQSVKDPLK